jgi:hypothetical protein
MRKAKWSAEEDDQLTQAIEEFGTHSWNAIASRVPGRTGKQCRERWIGQLAPFVSKEHWRPDEDATLILAHATAGNQWTTIAEQLPGRSALNVKNRWNYLLRHNMMCDRPCPQQLMSRAIYRPGQDVIERRKSSAVLMEPLTLNDGLFGSRFQEFQARMFMD